MTNQTPGSKLKFLFRLLPVTGFLCLIAGFGWALYQALDITAFCLIGLGHLLFLTLFIKAELANLRYYLHVTIYSVMVLALCVVAYLFARQYTAQIDLTQDKIFSLSEASQKYLKKLDRDVQITLFEDSIDPMKPFIDQVINLYSTATKKVHWEVLDAVKDPIGAAKFGEGVRNGVLFVTATEKGAKPAEAKTEEPGAPKPGEKKKKLNAAELRGNFENVITNAIVEVTREKNIKIYFLGGHGEVAYEQPAGAEPRQGSPEPSLGAFKNFLSERAIDTSQLDLAKTGFVPQDASMVVEAGPKSDLAPSEAAALQGYLQKGGKLLALLDVPDQTSAPEMANLSGLLKSYGVNAPAAIVLDAFSAQLGQNPAQPLVNWYNPTQPITHELSNRTRRFLLGGLARPIETGTAPQGLEVTDLLKSSDNSWSEDVAKLMASGRPTPPPVQAMRAQVLGVAVGRSAPQQMPGMPPSAGGKGGTRLVVYGTSDFIQDRFLRTNALGVELMLNTVNWLAEQEDMIAVPPRQLKGTPIVLDKMQIRLILVFAAILLPELLFFGGVSYSVLRRRR